MKNSVELWGSIVERRSFAATATRKNPFYKITLAVSMGQSVGLEVDAVQFDLCSPNTAVIVRGNVVPRGQYNDPSIRVDEITRQVDAVAPVKAGS